MTTDSLNDIYIYEATYYVQATSTTSQTVGTGSKAFVLNKDIIFDVGLTVTIANPDSDGANTMTGTVTSYISSSKTLTVNVASSGGSGTYTDWTIGGEGIFRFATSSFVTKPSETPAKKKYYDRVSSKGRLERSLFRPGATYGLAEVGVGNVVISNADRELDKLIEYDFSGRNFVVRKGTKTSAYPSGFTTLLTGVTSVVEHTWRTIIFSIHDKLKYLYDRPVQSVRYAGNNAIPNGVEGLEDDLKGQPKPILKGKVENINPPLVNTSKQTLQISHYQINSIDAVYAGGVSVTPGTAHASLSDLQAATVSAGTYDYYLGSLSDGAYLRIGSNITNTITVDATEGNSDSDRTAAQIAKWFLLNPGLVDNADLNAASITDLDTANSAVVGIWIGAEEKKMGEVLEEVLGSIGATLIQDREGEYKLVRFESPSGSPLTTITKYKVIDNLNGVERLASNDFNDGISAPYCILNYRKNYTLQNEADLASAALTRMTYSKEEYRKVFSAEDADIVAKYLLAFPWEFFTLLTNATDAQTEVDRRQTLYGTRREIIRIRCENRFTSSVDLNSLIQVQLDAYDWSEGKLFRVIGVEEDFDANKTILTLWG